ncbi:MAG TPA: helix-turn-helix domain-containing protein [Azospirillaceae bacterium]|nr:helix-turn-helix domain-containing protein [Azospirillaceae bacterium]
MAVEATVNAVSLEQPVPRPPSECPVEDWLAFLGHRWNALILWHLQSGPKRNSELATLLPGITPKVLSERLDGLEKRGLVRRSPIATFPRGVTYSLSHGSRELVRILDQLELWSRSTVTSELP